MRITEPYTIFKRTLKSGKFVYYYQFRNELGLRSPAYSCGTDKLSEAKRIVKNLYLEGKLKSYSSITFGTFTKNFFSKDNEYYKWKVANSSVITDGTLISYKMKLENQLMPYFYKIGLNAITPDLIKLWVIWCSSRWSVKTINNAQGVLNIILETAVEKKIIETNPLENIEYRKVNKKSRDLLTIDEIKYLYNCNWACEGSKNAFLLAAITGMRLGEICGLRKDCLYDNYVYVKQSYSDKTGLGDTKTKKHRFVPVPENLEFLKNAKDWVIEKDGEPIFPHTIYNNFVRLCPKLSIDKKGRGLTIHSLRNFFITYLQSKNVSLEKIKAVVGHVTKDMTEHYTYWKPELFPEVYEAQKELYKLITE